MDPISFTLGFLAGGLATTFAFWLSFRLEQCRDW